MKVTSIVKGKKEERFNIYLDNTYAFSVSFEVISEYNISIGTTLSSTIIEKIKERDNLAYAKSRAFLLLSRKSYSKNGLIKKLKEKGIYEDIALKVCEYLEDRGYINDEDFANQAVKYLFEIKKLGEKRVVYELVKRGIDKEYAKELAENYSSQNDSEINNVLQKLLKGKDFTDQKTRRQIFNKLVRMGYDFEDINSSFRKVNSED